MLAHLCLLGILLGWLSSNTLSLLVLLDLRKEVPEYLDFLIFLIDDLVVLDSGRLSCSAQIGALENNLLLVLVTDVDILACLLVLVL